MMPELMKILGGANGGISETLYGTQQAPTLLGSGMNALEGLGGSMGNMMVQNAPDGLRDLLTTTQRGTRDMFAPITQPLQGITGGIQDFLYGSSPQVSPVINAPLFTPSANYVGLQQPPGIIGGYIPNYGGM